MTLPTLLCVENDSTSSSAYAALLRCSGYRVLSARNGGQALAKCRDLRIDAVLVEDCQKIGASGGELAAKIKRASPATPVILVSSLQTVLEEARNFVDATLTKSADLEQVLAKLNSVLSVQGLAA
jgi:DNA-binding response OmpR family regulator